MNNYNHIAYGHAMANNNNVWMAVALSKCNSRPHSPPSKSGTYICGGVLLLMVIAFIATCIMIRKS